MSTTLKLENGKTYLNRFGSVFRIKKNSNGIFYSKNFPGYFFPDGRHSTYSCWDLVEEVTEKQTTLRGILESTLEKQNRERNGTMNNTDTDIINYKPSDFKYYRLVVTKNGKSRVLNNKFNTVISAQEEAVKICKSGGNISVDIVGGVIATYTSVIEVNRKSMV